MSERNYKHENSIQNLRQALVQDVESMASAVQASIGLALTVVFKVGKTRASNS